MVNGIEVPTELTPLASPQENLLAPEEEWEMRDTWLVNPALEFIMIRGQRVPVNLSPAYLRAKGIELREPPLIDPPALLRSLMPEYRDLLLATPSKIARCYPQALTTVLTLEDWHHPDRTYDELPGCSETF